MSLTSIQQLWSDASGGQVRKGNKSRVYRVFDVIWTQELSSFFYLSKPETGLNMQHC